METKNEYGLSREEAIRYRLSIRECLFGEKTFSDTIYIKTDLSHFVKKSLYLFRKKTVQNPERDSVALTII